MVHYSVWMKRLKKYASQSQKNKVKSVTLYLQRIFKFLIIGRIKQLQKMAKQFQTPKNILK